MNIGIIGTGYVGLVTGACLAEINNRVICVDSDEDKIKTLKSDQIPIYEPGLSELVQKNKKEGRLHFSTKIEDAVENSTIIFIAVGTPPLESGEADLSAIEMVSAKIAETMKDYRLVVEKSTVPVRTGIQIKRVIEFHNKNKIPFDVASNPEFLREGSAIHDFMHPDRIVIGCEGEKAKELLTELYRPINAPIIITDIESSEIIKHASNSFLAMKISYINAISNLCEKTGADILKVADGMGYDRRIGRDFLNAGIGFGGFCFPKDLKAFINISQKLGYDFTLLKEVYNINEEQKKLFVSKIKNVLWNFKDKTIGILGLSFKPNTDDLRFAPSIDIINSLTKEGANIKAYDPVAMEKAKKTLMYPIEFCTEPYDVAKDAHCLALITEWKEFSCLDWKKIKEAMKYPFIADGRNFLDPQKIKSFGFHYIGMGRGSYSESQTNT